MVACQRSSDGKRVAILITSDDCTVECKGREGGQQLVGDHRVRQELLCGLGWAVGMLFVEQWRRAGKEGGRAARVRMMREILDLT